MIKVYYDKNVASHIIQSRQGGTDAYGVTVDDFKALCDAVATGKIINLLSETFLQEAAPALRSQTSDAAREELRLIRDLMDTEQIIKKPKTLLTDDVISYARGEAPSSPLIPNPHDLEWVLNPGSSSVIAGHKKALDDTDQQNAEFRAKGVAGDDNDRDIILSEFGSQPSFEEFYGRRIHKGIVDLVKRVQKETGVNWLLLACEERGIEGMLAVRSVAVAAGITLSYQYANVFGELKKNMKSRKGDAPDLTHALLASAADIFVTHDQPLADWVDRIPNKGYEVLRHVHELVERIG